MPRYVLAYSGGLDTSVMLRWLQLKHDAEVFTVTAWGIVPTMEQLERDLPLDPGESARRTALAERLKRWGDPS